MKVEGRGLKGTTIAGADTAALIDEIPVLAAVAPYTEGGIEIRDARELRVKDPIALPPSPPICAPWERKSKSAKMV